MQSVTSVVNPRTARQRYYALMRREIGLMSVLYRYYIGTFRQGTKKPPLASTVRGCK